ncbi:hypothetical protein PTKIN_Ptkin07bG0245900 [Pterospermum kingtungense]
MEARFMIMPAGQSMNILLLMLMQMILAMLLGGVHAVKEWKTLSEEENLEMEEELKVINKPPIKSFQTEHGDILDCIDIYKQHAFDHPLLKDHKIQMRPKRIPNKMMGGKASVKTKSPRLLPKNIRCPLGSVLIKRTTKEDLIIAKEKKTLRLNHPTRSHLQRPVVPDADSEKNNYARVVIQYPNQNFGAKATMNVWNPSVSGTQFSSASISIENDSSPEKIEVIMAGWIVQPDSFKDNQTRLIGFWDAIPNKGCNNYVCPGFVQVSKEISLGIVLQSSIYNGTQQEIEIGILKDGEWWLKFNNNFVGYWPQKLFSSMKDASNLVFWGGQVHGRPNEPFPAMGSGHFPEDGVDGKSAYFKQMQIWDSVNLVYPEDKSLTMATDRLECYHYLKLYEGDAPFQPLFFYGGPSQCKH